MGVDLQDDRSPDTLLDVAPLEGEMRLAVARLLKVLASEEDLSVLGPSALREIIYRTLNGPAGPALHGLLGVDNRTARVAEFMDILNARPSDRFKVA